MLISSPRFFRISLLVLAMGVVLTAWRVEEEKSRLKTVEEYWAETGLSSSSLIDLIDGSVCATSERYFLACVNAIGNVAGRFDLGVSADGTLVPLKQSLSKAKNSEKAQLEPWKNLFREDLKKAQEISFVSLWKDLESHYFSAQQKAMMVGLGLNGFISVFRDPHTYFMPVSQFKEVVSKADNRSTSLGMSLALSGDEHVVRKVIEGSPAKLSGVQKGDILLSVNGESVKEMTQARVYELLRGEIGDRTTIFVRRGDAEKKFRLLRREITVATVSTRIIDGIKPIAVIGVNKFAKGACVKVKESLGIAQRAGVRGLLLDLRDNPGGQMEEAACVTSLFVGADKRIFEIRYLESGKKAEAYYGGEEKVTDLPLAVLVNASSASAAEIVAGSLRDFGRGVLVGEKTFGKGSFQEGEYWSQNKNIALFETKGFYYLPSGRSPQMKGLEPDVAVNFDRIDVVRESDQFVNPLKAPERKVQAVAKMFEESKCLQIEDGVPVDDAQLSRAREVLFCTNNVARAGL